MKVHNSSALIGLQTTHKLVLSGKKTILREKHMSDARDDYRWQSDPELAKLDATEPLNMSFAVYLLDYSIELKSLRFKRFPLAIDTADGKHIGNITLYDIDEKRSEAQLGILIGERDYWEKGFGPDAIDTLVDYTFRNTSLARLYLKTLDWNTRAQKAFVKSAFVPCGEMKRRPYNFLLMELTRERWEQLKRPGPDSRN